MSDDLKSTLMAVLILIGGAEFLYFIFEHDLYLHVCGCICALPIALPFIFGDMSNPDARTQAALEVGSQEIIERRYRHQQQH